MERHPGDVVAIQQQAAAVDVVEPGNQVHHGGLAGAGWGPTRAMDSPGLHVQVEVLQDVDFPIVGEGHIVKGDTARNGRQLGGAGGVVHGDGLVNHLEDTLQVGHGVDEGVVQGWTGSKWAARTARRRRKWQ